MELQSLQKMYESLEAEYKKYRVDMGVCDDALEGVEVSLWNKNAQIESVGVVCGCEE